jgi:hypothetical protein
MFTASIIRAIGIIMEAESISEKSVNFYGTHGAPSQKTAFL